MYKRWLVVLVFVQLSQAFSPETCQKLCTVSNWVCWFCQGVHGTPADSIKGLGDDILLHWLRAPTEQELIDMGKHSHTRQEKIVGGLPVKYGEEAPWTVRKVFETHLSLTIRKTLLPQISRNSSFSFLKFEIVKFVIALTIFY